VVDVVTIYANLFRVNPLRDIFIYVRIYANSTCKQINQVYRMLRPEVRKLTQVRMTVEEKRMAQAIAQYNSTSLSGALRILILRSYNRLPQEAKI